MVKFDTATQTVSEASTGATGWTLLKQYLVTPVLDLVFPPVCVGCHRVGMILCSECQATVRPEVYYPDAIDGFPAIVASLALGRFDGMLQQAVHDLKYNGQTDLAAPLGNLLAGAVQQAAWPVSLVTPVPLHSSRLAERGYNQSALLGAATARKLGWPFEENTLTRTRHTASQVGLDREARQANVHDAFAVSRPDAVKGMTVVLVDDVHTTGATLRECASMLYSNGAIGVRTMVIGRAGSGPSS